jgi:biopolymer transport protein TolR
MNHILAVRLITLTILTAVTPSAVGSPAAAPQNAPVSSPAGITESSAPPMRKGISVELPVIRGAVPVPKADNAEALIVAITYDGSLYFGVNPVTPAALGDCVKRALASQPEKKVYIKADARTPYANVVEIMNAVHLAGGSAITLLTSQPDSPKPGTLASPQGIELLMEQPPQ